MTVTTTPPARPAPAGPASWHREDHGAVRAQRPGVRRDGSGSRGAGLARGAFAAEAALAAARGTITVAADDGLRDLLAELVHAAGLVRRIGVNLNQAVARLHATGQAPATWPGTRPSACAARHLDAVAEQVRNALP